MINPVEVNDKGSTHTQNDSPLSQCSETFIEIHQDQIINR